MGKRISELPTVTALGDNDVAIFNHIDTSQSEPTTATSKITVSNLKQTLGINGKIDSTDIGAAGGVAELDGNGKIPSSQLPGYVDDVVEGYYDVNTDRFYEESGHTTVIPPVTDKLWVDVSTNKSYRWTGSVYVRVDEGVQLGETSGTAYRGDRGKTAYDHSQLVTGNPHGVTASDVGLGSVANTGDSDTPVSGGTTKFTTGGAFAELAKKADKVTGGSTGDFAGLDANGNLIDSGSKAADFAAATHTHTVSQITDFPSLGTAAALDVPVSGNASSSQVVKGDDTRLSVMTGAGASTAGAAGIVPAPAAGDESKVLSGAGIWVPQSSGGSGKADITSIGPDESGRTTASRAYAQGEHFYKDGKFCEAKTAIASGATLTLNTNYKEDTIANVITTLNSQLVDLIRRFSFSVFSNGALQNGCSYNATKYVPNGVTQMNDPIAASITSGGLLKVSHPAVSSGSWKGSTLFFTGLDLLSYKEIVIKVNRMYCHNGYMIFSICDEYKNNYTQLDTYYSSALPIDKSNYVIYLPTTNVVSASNVFAIYFQGQSWSANDYVEIESIYLDNNEHIKGETS